MSTAVFLNRNNKLPLTALLSLHKSQIMKEALNENG